MWRTAMLFGLLCLSCALADVYVSPKGSDTGPGTQSDPVKTIERAIKLAGAQSTIHISSGMYRLSDTLILTAKNDGLKFVGEVPGTVVLSGGLAVSGWNTQTSGQSQTAAHSNDSDISIAVAKCSVANPRHLYVNGRRAARAVLDDMKAEAAFKNARLTPYGYSVEGVDPTPLRPTAEFVFPQSTSPWTEPRCAVASVNATDIVMMQPCWDNLLHKACRQNVRSAPVGRNGFVENVGPDHLSVAGQWSYDPDAQLIHYALLPGELESTLDAELPVLEILVNISGASGISFTNISFQHATWLRPGQADGFVEQQTGACAVGTNPLNSNCGTDDSAWSIKSPGNIVLKNTVDISFTQCEFTRLGGAGIDTTASARTRIESSYFHDISGAAVQLGVFDDPLSGNQNVGNVVLNTVINKAGAEYRGAAGINVGYTQNTSLLHNDISNLSYVPISVGWGWARHACGGCTNAGNNTIAFNRAHDYKQVLNDGGGIYMLGPQNGSMIFQNWVYNQGTPSSGALYPDEGSAYSVWRENVVTNIGSSKWLHLWTSSIHNVTVESNYVDTSYFLNHGTNCPMINNTVFKPGAPPSAAVAIMNASGVEANSNPWMV